MQTSLNSPPSFLNSRAVINLPGWVGVRVHTVSKGRAQLLLLPPIFSRHLKRIKRELIAAYTKDRSGTCRIDFNTCSNSGFSRMPSRKSNSFSSIPASLLILKLDSALYLAVMKWGLFVRALCFGRWDNWCLRFSAKSAEKGKLPVWQKRDKKCLL